MNQIQLICEKVIKDLNTLDKTTKQYQDKYIYLYQIVRDMYPQQLQQLFSDIKLSSQVEIWKNKSLELMEQIDSFGINFGTKEIEVTMGSDQVNTPLIDIKKYIQTELNLSESDWRYHLVFSYLIQADVYENFQLVNTFLLGKSY